MRVRVSGERVEAIVSLLLYDSQCQPVLVALEYALDPQGVAWTVAGIKEKDFYKVLDSSGLLQMRTAQRASPGTASLMCVPRLGKGAVHWFYGCSRILLETDEGTPFLLIQQASPGVFEYVLHDDPRFMKLLQ